MTNNNLADLIKRAASTEATPALVDFWQRQYSTILGSRASYDADKQTGSLDLIAHLTSDKKDIDHQVLQQSIAVLVRFLDAITDDADFRSIHLSVQNFEEFLKITDTPPQIGVDYVGGLVADFGYRASENLAHEKGAFKALGSLPKHIRPVEYEMWADDHQNNKNGQELSTMFDDETVTKSPWKLLLRRNFAILDFPHELIYWDKWRDSYHDSANSVKVSIPVNSSAMLDDTSSADTTQESAFDTDFDFGEDHELQMNETQMHEAAEVAQNHQTHELMEEHNELTLEDLKAEPAPIDEHDVAMKEAQFDQNFLHEDEQHKVLGHEDLQVVETEHTIADDEMEMEKEELQEELEHEENVAPQDEYILGELVKIVDPNSPWKEHVFQVVDIQNGAIKLAGNDESLNQIEWHKDQLSKQNLYELLADLNQKSEVEIEEKSEPVIEELVSGRDYTASKAAAVIFNHQNQVLLFKDETNSQNKWSLPSIDIKLNQIPEEAIVKYLQSVTHNSVRILDEIGSVMSSYNPNDLSTQNAIYNIFLIDIDPELSEENSDYQYFDLESLPSSEIVVKVALDKHKRHQKLISDIITSKTQEWEKTQKSQLDEELKTQYETKLKEHIEQLNQQKVEVKSQDMETVLSNNTPEFNFHDDFYDENNQPKIEEPKMNHFGPDMKSVEPANTSNFAKFKVKLDTMIQSNEFGGINLTLGYTSRGIESISFSESSLDANLKSNLELILHLFNHLLSHGLDLKQLLSGLNLKHGQNEVPITEVLSLILQAIADAPARISDIGDNMLV